MPRDASTIKRRFNALTKKFVALVNSFAPVRLFGVHPLKPVVDGVPAGSGGRNKSVRLVDALAVVVETKNS